MSRFISACFFVLFFCSSARSETTPPVIVLLSIDGFAYEYIHKHQPPNILALSKLGISAKLASVYPSKTFPNHLSIITGKYPIHHGITNNAFYSPEIGQHYKLGAGKKNAAWLKADPLWTVAEQQGLKTAVYFWPESEALGKQPTYNIPFNTKDSNQKRFDQILQWLALPDEQRPRLIVSYFSTVDSAGHTYGPNSKEVEQSVQEIDSLIGKFIAKLSADNNDDITLILVSDHGMMEKDKNKLIKPSTTFDASIQNLIKTKAITMAKNDTQLYLYFTPPKSNNLDPSDVLSRLKVIAETKHNKNLYHIYSKGNYPKHWQLNTDSPLVPDIIIEAIPPKQRL
ncbi:ectonucleotide pyrophosphatase/phosphodiesterase [Colwellia sp. MSW7]|uniref:Ectonucleotide pyrophosphatase/phosphodiesterase n=1 Tax=Colwellia maritima TaxID=2912588 RepID=A0ABS9X1S3_9GAMM|nr:ectonucleotide pyrophosphatase/phosphodiesterase [Colwellia maritima]MCI2284203.1 ectonucleotide pyrophosphatase/phosphodiesterase [Colwellia maritima]